MKISARELATIAAALMSFSDNNPDVPNRTSDLVRQFPCEFANVRPLTIEETESLIERIGEV